MKMAFRSALLGLILLASSATPAAWVKYEMTFVDPGGAFNGTGSFEWDDSAHLLNNFFWDFGVFGSGGFNPALDWSAPLLGGTLAETLFEILTLQNVALTQCDSVIVDCSVTSFDSFGFPGFDGAVSIGFAEIDNVPEFRAGGAHASFVTTRRVSVPEPGSLLLVALGICGLGVFTRTKRA